MEALRKAWKWGIALIVAFFAGIGLWLEIRSQRNAGRIIREEIDRDKRESDDLVAEGDTQGMHDKLLDKDNWT